MERQAEQPAGALVDGSNAEVVYESATTRVSRIRPAGQVRKEALGPDGHERIRREHEILKLLAGMDFVVQIHGGLSAGPALVLDDGGPSLADHLQHTRLPIDDVLRLGEQLARILAAVHRAGVTHCDVCPSNIVLKSAQPLGTAMLIDFDLAHSTVKPPTQGSDATTGTLGYAAPEQSGRTARAVDHRADLYSLGATLYQLATGRLPFESSDPLQLMHDHLAREPLAPADVNPQVPKTLSAIILRLLAKDPDRRYEKLEQRVRERTAEIESLQDQLVTTAHRAGMAQIATNVLHNVGNLLNSVTVAAGGLKERVFNSRLDGLARAVALMKEQPDLAHFIANDPRGPALPKYLEELAATLKHEQGETMQDIQSLVRNVEHIAAVVSSQQSYANTSQMKQSMSVDEVFDEALQLAIPAGGTMHTREIDVPAAVEVDRTRVLQILVNLIANANDAMADCPERVLTLGARVTRNESGPRLLMMIRDTGHGIAKENLSRLFTHGFTTKFTGHGFGLHSAAIAAMEMGGSLTAQSDGPERGATFTLELPLKREGPAAQPAS